MADRAPVVKKVMPRRMSSKRVSKTVGRMQSSAPAESLDLFTDEIIRSYMISSVREMHQTTVRTAYSTCFSEGEDFTCALFDARGRMVAQANASPIHSGALVASFEDILEAFTSFAPGDVMLQNDPYRGATHQADVVVCRPIFIENVLVGFSANRGHWTDVGGMAPGGWSGTVRHVVQEALIIPPVKLYRAGVLDPQIRDFILKNVRVAKQCWGDIQAQVASNVTAERRLKSLADKYGLPQVLKGMERAIRYSAQRFARALLRLPDGHCAGEEVQEEDGHGGGPYKIRVAVRKEGKNVTVDFTGTDHQARGPVNCSFAATRAATYSAIVAVVDPTVPMNSGVLQRITVIAPAGCLVNPVYPAPVFASTADPADKVAEAVLKALAEIVPDRVMAGSYCTGNNLTGSGETEDGEDFLWYVYESGGCGARSDKDGNSVEWHLMANNKNESMEMWEARYPVQFLEYSEIIDSGGPGKYRGGLGSSRKFRILTDTWISGCADRRLVPPWGLFGGGTGMANRFAAERNGVEYDLKSLFPIESSSKFSDLHLKSGDAVVVVQGGGGGYGDPLERDPELVEVDVLNGYVSPEQARNAYRVSIDPQTGKGQRI